MRQSIERGRWHKELATHCRKGHNDWVENGTDKKTCGECRRERARKSRRNPNSPRFTVDIRGDRGAYKHGQTRSEV